MLTGLINSPPLGTRFQKKNKNVYEIYIYFGQFERNKPEFNLRNNPQKIVPLIIGLKPNICIGSI